MRDGKAREVGSAEWEVLQLPFDFLVRARTYTGVMVTWRQGKSLLPSTLEQRADSKVYSGKG